MGGGSMVGGATATQPQSATQVPVNGLKNSLEILIEHETARLSRLKTGLGQLRGYTPKAAAGKAMQSQRITSLEGAIKRSEEVLRMLSEHLDLLMIESIAGSVE